MNPVPFMTKEEFEAAKCKPDALFPIMDYDICKCVWERSPLIKALCESLVEPKCGLCGKALKEGSLIVCKNPQCPGKVKCGGGQKW